MLVIQKIGDQTFYKTIKNKPLHIRNTMIAMKMKLGNQSIQQSATRIPYKQPYNNESLCLLTPSNNPYTFQRLKTIFEYLVSSTYIMDKKTSHKIKTSSKTHSVQGTNNFPMHQGKAKSLATTRLISCCFTITSNEHHMLLTYECLWSFTE